MANITDVSSTTGKIADTPTLFRISKSGSAQKIDAARYKDTEEKVKKVWKEAKTLIENEYGKEQVSNMRLDFAKKTISFALGGKEQRITLSTLGVIGNDPGGEAKREMRKALLREIGKIGDALAEELEEPRNTEPDRPIRYVAQNSRWDHHRNVQSYNALTGRTMGDKFRSAFRLNDKKNERIESRLRTTDVFIQELQNTIDTKLKDLKKDKDANKSKIKEKKQLIEELETLQKELKNLEGPQRIAIYAAIATRLECNTENQTEGEFDTHKLPEMETHLEERLTSVLRDTLPVEDRGLVTSKLPAKVRRNEPDPKGRIDSTIIDSAQAAASLLSRGASLEHLIVHTMVHWTEDQTETGIDALPKYRKTKETLQSIVQTARSSVQSKFSYENKNENEDGMPSFQAMPSPLLPQDEPKESLLRRLIDSLHENNPFKKKGQVFTGSGPLRPQETGDTPDNLSI